MRAHGLRAAGAMQRLAGLVAETDPDVLAVCEIDAGDAFALATRFARGWAYRGSQALFWKPPFAARAVRDLYLPFAVTRPFDRRGLVRVDGTLDRAPLALFATQFAPDRATAAAELRFARARLAEGPARSIAFAQSDALLGRIGGRGYEPLASDAGGGLRIAARGLRAVSVERRPYSLIVATASHGMPAPQ